MLIKKENIYWDLNDVYAKALNNNTQGQANTLRRSPEDTHWPFIQVQSLLHQLAPFPCNQNYWHPMSDSKDNKFSCAINYLRAICAALGLVSTTIHHHSRQRKCCINNICDKNYFACRLDDIMFVFLKLFTNQLTYLNLRGFQLKNLLRSWLWLSMLCCLILWWGRRW